ncbi:hypothetical protein GNZ18_01150 [Actinomadura sp. NEAU-AAG5]|uniref:Glycosyltransferase RgtA/B/C/D-like domain-containing protein n=1 Tax=Actinomadura litoris TaxID=2678616 RepID=A0A7K1KT57_9ACTN|nr:hypothetical protein [Actinomadura litoris]
MSGGCGEIAHVPVGLTDTASRRADPPDSPARRWTDSPWLVPGLLGLAWLAVLILNLRTPVPSDQLNYMLAADRFPHRVEATTEMHQVTRFGLIVPVRLAIMVFGYSQAAYATVPILATLTLLLGTYALGTLLFARPAGVAAALIVVAATPVAIDSTDLLPDVFAAGLFVCALALAVWLRRRPDAPGPGALLAVGALLGWSYLAREFVVFMWPVVVAVLFRRTRWTGLLWVAAPVALIGLAELALCWRLYGDPFARAQAILGHGQRPSTPSVAASYRDKSRMTYVLRLPHTLRAYPEGRVLKILIGLTLLGGLLRMRRILVLVAACASLWLPLTLLGGVLDPSAPKLRLQLIRYWFPVFPAFVLGGVGLVWIAAAALAGRIPRRGRARVAAAAALPAAAVLAVAAVSVGPATHSWWAGPATRAGGGTQLESLRSWMRDNDQGPDTRVWTDKHTRRVLKVYQDGAFGGQAWPGRIRTVPPDGERPRPGDLLVVFDAETGRVCALCRVSAQTMLRNPVWAGPGWRQVYGTDDRVVRVYRLAPG